MRIIHIRPQPHEVIIGHIEHDVRIGGNFLFILHRSDLYDLEINLVDVTERRRVGSVGRLDYSLARRDVSAHALRESQLLMRLE